MCLRKPPSHPLFSFPLLTRCPPPTPTPPTITYLLCQALQYEEAKGKADAMYTALSISYGDLGTDIAVGVQLLNSAHPVQGIVTFAILGFALFLQAATAIFFRAGPGGGRRGLVRWQAPLRYVPRGRGDPNEAGANK